MSITIKRGPQKTEFFFDVDFHKKEIELEKTFERLSGFYRDKNGNWQIKECELVLGYYVYKKYKECGLIKINMASMIGQEAPAKKIFDFEEQTESLSAKVELSFRITEVNVPA